MPSESGRRLCLLFEAGHARYAIEATSVVEVSPPDPDGGTLRGNLEVEDLSQRLGGSAEVRPGLVLVVDVSPTRALRIARVVEVADVAESPFFMLPPGLGERLGSWVRGALLHRSALYLELDPEAVARPAVLKGAGLERSESFLEVTHERALVFESGGERYGLPLGWVLQVVPASEAFIPLPSPGGPVAGLFAHAQTLWPIYSVPGLRGRAADCGPLFVLADLAGHHVGLCAERVLGVQPMAGRADAPGEHRVRGIPGNVLFLDLQRMFSSERASRT